MSTSIPYYVRGYMKVERIIEVNASDSEEAMRIAKEEYPDFIPEEATYWNPEGDDE